ncbi:hypothetical protein BASA83_012798 [Batrachochytrium salamandrivorans]|nr:hypothetical protein BASA83_012798 [Batrachochytrium salamandrivorans]
MPQSTILASDPTQVQAIEMEGHSSEVSENDSADSNILFLLFLLLRKLFLLPGTLRLGPLSHVNFLRGLRAPMTSYGF